MPYHEINYILRPTQLRLHWIMGITSFRLKRPGIGTERSHLLSAQVKNVWNYCCCSTPPYTFISCLIIYKTYFISKQIQKNREVERIYFILDNTNNSITTMDSHISTSPSFWDNNMHQLSFHIKWWLIWQFLSGPLINEAAYGVGQRVWSAEGRLWFQG
jgi:hypothetical protein